MHIHAVKIKNFRRLKDVVIELDKDLSIFVGSNNSGKTSTGHALQLFTTASKEKLSIHDFNVDCWSEITSFGDQVQHSQLPSMYIDLWFHVEESDLHRVMDLLPNLNWSNSLIGLRVEFSAVDQNLLLTNFLSAKTQAENNIRRGTNEEILYHPRPKNLNEYLEDNLKKEFEFKYYILNRSNFTEELIETEGYKPSLIPKDKSRGGKEILNSILKVDFLNAQRHLSDSNDGSRTEELSKRLGRFYERNLEKLGEDYDAMQALSISELTLNQHLSRVFKPTLDKLGVLGYPGVNNPKLIIKSALNPATVLSSNDGAKVYYSLGETGNENNVITLPDRYNGLGYKNLIYMVVELIDIHTQWMDVEENRPPLHLIFIEEPEAHLHAQLQQTFIRKVIDILKIEGEESAFLRSQLVITTHSTHILYERGFLPLRYFRRHKTESEHSTKVLNLNGFYKSFPHDQKPVRDFLQRYMKLTHCDLFFADAAILVEGNVERLLLPLMIEKSAPELKSTYISILEIGGAFGHKFKSLIEYLGITTLIITDIDSVDNSQIDEDEEDEETIRGKACLVETENSITSNQMLRQWLPCLNNISDLLQATAEDKTQNNETSLVKVAYQTPVNMTWNDVSANKTGRTLEESFAFENINWCQDIEQKDIKLRFPRSYEYSLDTLVEKLHKRIKGSSFKKTEFALGLLMKDSDDWMVPLYISEGLLWLQEQLIQESNQGIDND
jgi:predicted ATP-dependent endonuclease of OLD family